MRGLKHFRDNFNGFKDQYTIIGGTATFLNLEKEGVLARATKDLDIVIIIENLTEDFVTTFWEYISNGQYEHKNASSNYQFYRFNKPKNQDYPFMIEILSKEPEILKNGKHQHSLSRLAVEDEIVSLSAIILDDVYYEFIKENLVEIDGIMSVNSYCIIPLKIRAYLDLALRKANGEDVKSRDVKKHKNDVFRLTEILSISEKKMIDDKIRTDIIDFIEIMEHEDIDFKAMKLQGNKQQSLDLLKQVYLS